MIIRMLLILSLQLASIWTAPLQLQWQSQLSMQPSQEELLEQQLHALQQLQAVNQLAVNQLNNNNDIYQYTRMTPNIQPPLILILPDLQQNVADANNNLKTLTDFNNKNNEVRDQVTDNKDLDSIVIEAEPSHEPAPEPAPKKAILLIPNRGRLSFADLISAIPFLPIEINVPDTISWIYNGISSIIAGIGQRLPFRPQNGTPQDNNLRVLLKRLQAPNQNYPTPILVLPEVAQVYPI